MANILTENLMNYEIILSNGLEQFIFSYELNDDAPTKNWVNLSKETSPIDLRKSLNPWRGILSTYNDLVNDFNEVIDELNCWLPVKIENKWQINFHKRNNSLLWQQGRNQLRRGTRTV